LAHFKDDNDVYRFIGRLLQELAQDPELAPQFRQADTTVRFALHDPDAQMTIVMCRDREMQVDLGPSELDPEVVMSMAADTAHGFWVGKVNLTAALGSGEINATGPVAKILRFVPLVTPSFVRYEQMLREAGRTDLLEAA
jgi:putative sterol carrier protein